MRRGLGAVITAAVLMMAGCGGHEPEAAEAAELPEAGVRVGVVEEREGLRTQGLPGTVHPSDQAVIASKLMATVETVGVSIGERVKQGDLLVELDAAEIAAQVEQARAAVAQLERNLEREQALLAQSATTAEAVRTLEDEIRQARARLREAEIMDGYTRIRAPFDGIITAKEVLRGDFATPGMPLLTLEGLGNLEVHVQVPDSLVALPIGESVEVRANGAVLDGRLQEWSPAADPASRTRLAKLQMPGETHLRSGQYVTVNWPAEATRSLWMPAGALSEVGQLDRVFRVEDGSVQLQLIRTGKRVDDEILVLAGLEAGDTVVLDPDPALRDGQPARVQP